MLNHQRRKCDREVAYFTLMSTNLTSRLKLKLGALGASWICPRGLRNQFKICVTAKCLLHTNCGTFSTLSEVVKNEDCSSVRRERKFVLLTLNFLDVVGCHVTLEPGEACSSSRRS